MSLPPVARESSQRMPTEQSRPAQVKAKQIKRIMTESAATFTHEQTARQYIALYEKMLQRPLVVE